MALFTGKGDDGTTKTFNCPPGKRISKSSAIAEALGSMDEVNSFLGLCKVKSEEKKLSFQGISFESIVHEIQQNLFIVQAELAGADKSIEKEKVSKMEDLINEIEKELPPINSFFISGGTELAAIFDVSRTLARRAERRVVAVQESLREEENREIGEYTRAYLNRLSSMLYALARLSNHLSGIKEEPPSYK
jgi:cob(I)alamin adenosyltransferase